MAKVYRPYFPEQDFLLPPSLRECLSEDHLSTLIRAFIRIYRIKIYLIVSVLKTLDIDKLWKAVAGLPDDWKKVSAITGLGCCPGRLSQPTLIYNVLDAIIHDHGQRDKREYRSFPESVLRIGVQISGVT
jgi:hypothetical protein